MTTTAAPGVRIGPQGLPQYTLGWQVLGWTREYLLHPDGPKAGEPWDFTDEQAHFVVWWYAIDQRGRFLYRKGMLRRMKGWGKDPVGAAISCVEFVGPCRFGGWRGETEPVAVPHSAAWVQIAAVAKDQTRNTMTLFAGMLSRAARDEYSIDLGKEIIYGHQGRCRIEAVTSSPRALEGGRPTFVLKNEPHHWILANEGTDMAAVIARNVAKSRDGSARVLSISNAHAPGEGSDAELDYEAWRKDPSGFLYDSLEAAGDVEIEDAAAVKAALECCRGDSDWVDIERLTAEVQDPRTQPDEACRFYFNQLKVREGRAFSRERWADLERCACGHSKGAHDERHDQGPDCPCSIFQPGYKVPAGALITLGFDGSVNRDWTALIGTEVATGFQWPIGIWEPELQVDGEVRIPVGEVEAAVEATFEQWDIWRMNMDPFWWQEQMAGWAGRYNKPGRVVVVSWNTTLYRKMAFAVLNYRNAQQGGELSHDGDPRFAQAIGNAYRQEQGFFDDKGQRMFVLRKERPDSPFKIDPAVAGALSFEARQAAIAAGAKPRGRGRISVGIAGDV